MTGPAMLPSKGALLNFHISTHLHFAGQVLTVETIGVRITTSSDGKKLIDSERTRWTDSASDDCPYAFVLRIFYNKEINGRIYGSERTQIGIVRFSVYYVVLVEFNMVLFFSLDDVVPVLFIWYCLCSVFCFFTKSLMEIPLIAPNHNQFKFVKILPTVQFF